MLDKVRKTIREYNMLQKGNTIVVAVSGGVDSVVLLHILMRLAPEYQLSLIAAHINHCLRGKESDRDEAFVKQRANKLGVKCVCKRIDILPLMRKGDSLQDIAREARYAFFEKIAKKYKADKIATGHTMDDQAETMIMRFLKGAGLHGLSGILPTRGKYIRPLLYTTREEIETYATQNKISFVKDSSNKSTKYLRNRIRLKLIPILEDYNPRLKNDMARLARILTRDEEYLLGAAKDIYNEVVGKRDENAISFYLGKLDRLHDAIKARVFFMAVEELLGSSRGFYSCHIENFLELLQNDAPNVSLSLPHTITLYKEYNVVTIEQGKRLKVKGQRRFAEATGNFEQELKIRGDTKVKMIDKVFKTTLLKSPNFRLQTSKSHVAYFDYDKLKLPLIMRNFRPGDRFIPLGMKGHKKVKDLFIEKKIIRRTRRLIPILVSDNEIIWVAGIRQAEYGKIEPETKKALKVEMKEQSTSH